MSVASEAWVVKHSPYRGSAYHVHKAIGEVVNKERGWLFYGRLTEFAKKTRIDRKTIGNAITQMVRDGYLDEVRSPMELVDIEGEVELKPTGFTGVYRFKFVRAAPVVYDAEGKDLAEEDGGEADSSPPVVVISSEDSHDCVSPGHSTGPDDGHRLDVEGEEISSPLGGGGESAAPGEADSSPGGEIAARNCIELKTELEEPPNPHAVGARGTRVAHTNPRAAGTSPRDDGTNPRARTLDAFLAADDVVTDEPVPIAQHLRRIRDVFDDALTTEGAQP